MKPRLTGLGLVFSSIMMAGLWCGFTEIKYTGTMAIASTLFLYMALGLAFSEMTTVPKVRLIVALAGVGVGVLFYAMLSNLGVVLVASAISTMVFAFADNKMVVIE